MHAKQVACCSASLQRESSRRGVNKTLSLDHDTNDFPFWRCFIICLTGWANKQIWFGAVWSRTVVDESSSCCCNQLLGDPHWTRKVSARFHVGPRLLPPGFALWWNDPGGPRGEATRLGPDTGGWNLWKLKKYIYFFIIFRKYIGDPKFTKVVFNRRGKWR
jgi:hypothetical protein